VSLRAIFHGVRVAVHQMRCRHTLVRASVTVVGGGYVVPVMVCRRCGWTDLQPLVW
jgi:hypothetical protein